MYADELKTVFHRDGFTLTGFVGPNPDSKEDKLYTLSDLHKLSTVFDDGQLHAGKTTICTAQWERIGNKTEDSSAYYTKPDDGTVKIESVDQDELKKQLETDSTAQIDVSGLEAEKVTLPVSAVRDVRELEAKALSIEMADAEISHYFRELFKYSEECRFNNCTHRHEPGCAVIQAVNDGLISESRYKSYLSILDDRMESKYREEF